jgi:hypothetical protein
LLVELEGENVVAEIVEEVGVVCPDAGRGDPMEERAAEILNAGFLEGV